MNWPNYLEVWDARDHLTSGIAGNPEYSLGLKKVLKWLKVNFNIMLKRLTLKARQTNPYTPSELIRQYQVVVSILEHFSRFSDSRPYDPNGVQKVPGEIVLFILVFFPLFFLFYLGMGRM